MPIHSPYQQHDLLLFDTSSERLHFQKVTALHHADWLTFCAFPGSLDYIGLHEYSTPEAKNIAWFDRVNFRYENNLGGMNALIEKNTGKLVGQAGLLIQEFFNQQFLEIGYSLHPDFRGKGFAAEAARFLMLRAEKINISDEVISVIHVDNEASMHVARANGMSPWKETISKGDPVILFRKEL